jgi:hypothetical protein
MSTVDTLITAVAAVTVNDVYKPYVNPRADDRRLLRAARFASVGVTLLGVALVPVFAQFKTIYAAHGAMTAAITPPLVVALLFAVFWRRFTAAAALWTIVGGLLAIAVSLFVPELIAPFAHGVPMDENFRDTADSIFAGAREYKFMRALFGLAVSAAIGVGVTLFTRPEPFARQRGLVWGTVADAIRRYKGSAGRESESRRALAHPRCGEVEGEPRGEGQLAPVRISEPLARALAAEPGDLVYVTDRRAWLGGLRSAHAVVDGIYPDETASIELGPKTHDVVVAPRRRSEPLRVERLY